jgi:hypothetical protein
MKWYKMDCDIQDNLDMRKLIDEWGWDWFGRYCAIIGKVGMLVTEHCQTFALQTNDGSPFPVRLLSNDLSTNVERLTNFCQYLADNRLIDKDTWDSKNLIFIPKLKDRADEYTRKLLTNSRHTPDQEVEEEVDKKKKKSTKRVLEYKLPDSLNNELFSYAFNSFFEFRNELKKPVTQQSCTAILKKLSKYPCDIAIKMLEQSIENGWQGVFELKGNYNGTRNSQSGSRPTAEAGKYDGVVKKSKD